MPPKRASDEAELSIFSKLQRIGDAITEKYGAQEPLGNGHEFSSSVKRKLADSKRTGQACDRCKVRKIRCDGRPEGCTPCEQNRTPCRTTDRITGRATTRGQVEAMEGEVSQLRSQLADLQAQLKENGIEPRVATPYSGIQPPTPSYQTTAHANDRKWSNAPRRTSSPTTSYTPVSATEKPEYRTLPQFKHGSIGDNYLGVGVGDTRLSHIRGTSLSIFGTDIDITDYMQGDYENSVMSYSSLISICVGNEPVEPVPLPPYHSLKEYAMWYLRSLNPYTMLVHKPAFLELVNKFGNDPTFQPTVPQIVMVHMMLSSIQYQIATRNSQSIGLLEESHKHYKYALSFYKQLTNGNHNLEDVQALGMICHHLRNFPKPGAAWIMTSITYLFALELGLHRSVKNWKDGYSHLSKLEIEMRKRLFWTLNALQVNLNGKLGRPMPISNEDIDVEFPEPMNDCLPGEEEKLDDFHRCSFQVGIQIAKYTVLEVDLYKMIYSVRSSPTTYLERLKTLDTGIRRWKAELPYELRDPAHASQDDTIFCLYLEYWYQAFNLSLHHPAVCRSLDPAVMASNLDACHEASQKMLQNCNEMMQKKSLDIPWINTVVYIAAIFTTLYISSIRHAQLSAGDLAKLKDDMIIWTNVLGECDHFLGSGDNLKNAIAQIIDQSLHTISNSISKRTASESIARAGLQASQQPSSAASMYESGGYREQYAAASIPTDPALTSQTSPTYDNMAGAVNHPYDMSSSLPVQQQSNNMYDQQQSYSTPEDPAMTSTHAAALVSATNPTSQAPNNYNAYAQPHNTAHSTPHTQHTYAQSSFAPQDWRQWTRTYMQPTSQNLGQPGDYLNTATTLMALGGSGRDGTNGGTHNPGSESQQGVLDGVHAHGSHGHGHGVGGQVHAHWPEIVFSGGVGSTSGVGVNGHLAQ